MTDLGIMVLPHKATPLERDQYWCALCGRLIRKAPGGSGPLWVHAESGAVASFPEQNTRLVIRGLLDKLGPCPWGAEALAVLADWLAALGFTVEESTASAEEYIQGLAQAHGRNDEWRCSDRGGNQLLVGQRVTLLGPRAKDAHKGEGSVTRLLPGAPADVPNVVVTDDNGLDITVNCVNVEIDPRYQPDWAADWGKP